MFAVRGVSKRRRDYYLVWEEGKGPEAVIELTSKSTREEDVDDKFKLYQDTLQVSEYFLFDPYGDYLDPQLKGYRLSAGKYVPIEALAGRLPSEVLGVHLEQNGNVLRLYDPATKQWVPTPREALTQARAEKAAVEAARQQEETCRRRAEAEIERLRRELQDLQRRLPDA